MYLSRPLIPQLIKWQGAGEGLDDSYIIFLKSLPALKFWNSEIIMEEISEGNKLQCYTFWSSENNILEEGPKNVSPSLKFHEDQLHWAPKQHQHLYFSKNIGIVLYQFS